MPTWVAHKPKPRHDDQTKVRGKTVEHTVTPALPRQAAGPRLLPAAGGAG